MYRFFFIAKNNIKKQKSDMITFFILSGLSSLFIFISASFLADTGKVIDTNMEKINAADIFIITGYSKPAIDKMEELIKGYVYLKNYEVEEYLDCSSKYRLKGSKNWIEYPLIISSYEKRRGRFHRSNNGFGNWIDRNDLVDLGFIGSKFTWMTKRGI